MNIFRVHRLPYFQAPDVPTDPAPAVDPALAAQNPPAVDPAAPPVADPAPVDPAAAADPTEAPPHGNKGKTPWYMSRMSELSHETRQERDLRLAAEERARNAEALLERAQNPNAPQNPPRADDAAVEARAAQIAEERIARQNIQSVIGAGVGEYEDWNDRTRTLEAAGAANAAFVLNVHAVDAANAHKILHALSDDPDKAARLARMDVRSQTVELVKMSLAAQGALAVPAADSRPPVVPRKVSGAPAPPPPIEPGASQTVDWRTDKNISDSDWSKKWDEDQRQKATARRR